MQANRRLLAIVTVMMMVGTHSNAQQIFSIEELRAIEELIAQKDCGALYVYLEGNPKLTFGDDPLAVELRIFRQDVDAGRLDCFAQQSPSFRDATEATAREQVGRAANPNIY